VHASQVTKAAIALSVYTISSLTIGIALPYKVMVSEKHDTWSSSNGFPGGHVYSITQTGDGFLWIGTVNGLVRFDGLNFTAIRMHTSEVLANPSIIGLATDAKGDLWTTNGLQIFRQAGTQWTVGLPARGPQPYQNSLVASAPGGVLLCAAGFEGILSYDSNGTHRLIGPGEMPGAATALAQASDGTLWVGTHIGLFNVELIRGAQLARRIEGLSDTKVNCLLLLGPHRLLIGTDKGLWLWDTGTVTQAGINAQLKTAQVLAIAQDLDDSVWIGTQSGLFKADRNQITSNLSFQSAAKLSAGSVVTALYADREGDMWVGGLDGIERYRASAFATYSVSRGSTSINGGPIYVDDQGRTWFGPSTGGLMWFNQNGTTEVGTAGLKADGVYSIAGGGGGDIWVGRKRGGLTLLRTHAGSMQARTYTTGNGLAENAVYSVYRSPDGTVWAGTLGKGLSRFRHGEFTTFTTKDGLLSDTISAITGSPSSSSLFVGTPNGLNELRNNRWITYTTRDGLPPGPLDCLLLDKEGTLWIGTTKGIACLRSGTIQVPTKVPETFSEEVLGIAEGEGGWLWITTPGHVGRVRRGALQSGVLRESDYREYGATDGLDSVEGVKRSPSVIEDQQGRVWFSLNRGISVVNPAVLVRQSTAASIHLDDVLADERTMPLGSRVRIPSGTHRITFHFASVSLADPNLVRYRYRMDGFDADWSPPVAVREANYTNIPPGHLRFRVMARNADGLWNSQEAEIGFEVEPAYWQTRPFQVFSVAGLLLLGFGLYRLRIFQLTRQLNLRFEERLAERTRISRELHDTLLQNLTGLALQISGTAKLFKGSALAAERMQQLKLQAEDCVRETRRSVWDIRSGDGTTQELARALQESGEQLTAGKAVRFVFTSEGQACELPSDAKQHLLRIAREAIGNAVQHGAATEIQVKLSFATREIQLVVEDDGQGFDVATKKNLQGHFGLATMMERAAQIGARIQVTSVIEQGSSIYVKFPRKPH